MKKVLLSLAAATTLALAGGFTHSGNGAISVKEALGLKDDAPVVLVGKISAELKHEHYTFVDANGDSIEVEIDDKLWGDINANENTMLKISGEIDKEFSKTSVDVKRVELAE